MELLDKCPGLKWVFDTANPIFNPDRSKPKPWPRQDAWEFWEHIRDHTAHIHVKDATWNPAKNDADYNWPGEGKGYVREILKDAFARGYDAASSVTRKRATRKPAEGAPNLSGGPRLDDLYRLPMPKLFALAEKEGIAEHTGMNRAQLIVAIVRRQIERAGNADV